MVLWELKHLSPCARQHERTHSATVFGLIHSLCAYGLISYSAIMAFERQFCEDFGIIIGSAKMSTRHYIMHGAVDRPAGMCSSRMQAGVRRC